MSLLIASCLLLITSGFAADTLSLHLLPGEAYCLDGSPAGYYLNRNASSDLWVVYMQGGGACFTAADCAKRANSDLGSSKKWAKTMSPDHTGKEIISRDCKENPDFCMASPVYVRYCSGDGHRGQRTNSTTVIGSFRFSGHNNFKAIVNHLKAKEGLGEANKGHRTLLTGCSAGGTGTMTNADTLADMLDGQATVKASPLAGWFSPGAAEDHPTEDWCAPSFFTDYSAGQSSNCSARAEFYKNAILLFDAYLQPDCLGRETSTWQCFSAHIYAQYIHTPLLVAENQFDKHQVSHNNMPQKEASTPAGKAYLTYFGRAMRTSTERFVQKTGNALFMPSCYDHCGHIGVIPVSAEIGGVKYKDMLGDWFFERGAISKVLTDSCGEVPCNPTCPVTAVADCNDDAESSFILV